MAALIRVKLNARPEARSHNVRTSRLNKPEYSFIRCSLSIQSVGFHTSMIIAPVLLMPMSSKVAPSKPVVPNIARRNVAAAMAPTNCTTQQPSMQRH